MKLKDLLELRMSQKDLDATAIGNRTIGFEFEMFVKDHTIEPENTSRYESEDEASEAAYNNVDAYEVVKTVWNDYLNYSRKYEYLFNNELLPDNYEYEDYTRYDELSDEQKQKIKNIINSYKIRNNISEIRYAFEDEWNDAVNYEVDRMLNTPQYSYEPTYDKDHYSSLDYVAAKLQKAIGEYPEISYDKEENKNNSSWYIEPDGSATDMVEVVSPPMDAAEAVNNLPKILNMIASDENLFTTNKCGLHINVGTWKNTNDIDLLKFIIFLGDEYLLNQFNRLNNTYSKKFSSYLESLERNKLYIEDTNKVVLDLMSEHYAVVSLQKFEDKGYMEIRAFGNENYEYKEKEIMNAIKRILRALEIAEDPNAYRNEYLKKLTKYIGKADKFPIDNINFISNIINQANSFKENKDSGFQKFYINANIGHVEPNMDKLFNKISILKEYIKNNPDALDKEKLKFLLDNFNEIDIPKLQEFVKKYDSSKHIHNKLLFAKFL